MGKEGIGDVFCDHKKEAHTNPYRFVTQSLTLQRVNILVQTQAVHVGRQGNQCRPIAANGELELTNIDLADLWFKNDVASADVYLIGTTKD